MNQQPGSVLPLECREEEGFDEMPLDGEERVATVLFADLRGFTALVENRRPSETMYLVNRCVRVMISCVRAEGGRLDKFLGDGIMAVFGVPEPLDDHPLRALRAARAMQEGMQRLAPLLNAEGWRSVGIGVGIETGRLVAGHVSMPGWREYTVLGDIVNVASRLTAGAAAGEVVLGAGAAAAVTAQVELVPLGRITIRGRRQAVDAWRLP